MLGDIKKCFFVVQKGSKGLYREHLIVYDRYEKCQKIWYDNENKNRISEI